MIHQHPFNFVAKINLSAKEDLRKILKEVNDDIEENPYIPFIKIKSIHFARFVVLDEVMDEGKMKYPAYLVFSTNYDGDINKHLTEFIAVSGAAFSAIFSACEGYPGDKLETGAYLHFLKANAHYKAYFYRGTWGRSVEQIRHEDEVRMLTESFLDKHEDLRDKTEKEILSAIQTYLEHEGKLKEFPFIKRPKLNGWKIAMIALIVLLSLPLLIIILPILLIILRIHEHRDTQQDEIYSDLKETADLKKEEDYIVQNQLTHLVEIRPSAFRRFMLKFVLEAIYFLARNYYNKGDLGGVSTIHFARWIIIDKGKRLLFFSNFDSSWESYLSDFVDRVALGLTAVWSNTEGFPKTKFLIMEGAKDEQRFKAWARRKQVPTDVWYSAYKKLTVKNINNNTALYEGLFKAKTTKEIKQHLARY